MYKKLGRTRLVALIAVTTFILAGALVAAAFYLSSGAALASKDEEILRLRTQMLTQNVTVLNLELSLIRLNANLTVLNERVAALALNQTFNKAELSLLSSQITTLENETAKVTLELAIAGEVMNFSVSTLVTNETITVRPSTMALVTTQPNGHNGTLVFYSQSGCPGSGDRVQAASGQYELYILLNSTSRPMMSDFKTLTTQPYTVYLENIGPSLVTCTFSLFYVQH